MSKKLPNLDKIGTIDFSCYGLMLYALTACTYVTGNYALMDVNDDHNVTSAAAIDKRCHVKVNNHKPSKKGAMASCAETIASIRSIEANMNKIIQQIDDDSQKTTYTKIDIERMKSIRSELYIYLWIMKILRNLFRSLETIYQYPPERLRQLVLREEYIQAYLDIELFLKEQIGLYEQHILSLPKQKLSVPCFIDKNGLLNENYSIVIEGINSFKATYDNTLVDIVQKRCPEINFTCGYYNAKSITDRCSQLSNDHATCSNSDKDWKKFSDAYLSAERDSRERIHKERKQIVIRLNVINAHIKKRLSELSSNIKELTAELNANIKLCTSIDLDPEDLKNSLSKRQALANAIDALKIQQEALEKEQYAHGILIEQMSKGRALNIDA